ncbi:MAG: hypothetical protein EOO01_29775 [Chitinophagaceae bacterium]|nr:MAG: hypothetical protein EOO01_29775 [Chitinophagaceae bacterium]
MKNSILPFLLLAGICIACNNEASHTESVSKDSIVQQPKVDSAALQASGVYGGFVPCADCKGIMTYLSLHPDMTYSLEETYYERDDQVFRTASTWKMDNGKIILYDNDKIKLSFLRDNEKLYQLDHEGNRISGNLGDKYVLTKQGMIDKSRFKEKAAAGIDFIGHGTEPFWGIEIDKEKSITLTSPNFKDTIVVPYAEGSVANNVRQFHIESGKTKLDIVLTPQFCSDGMGDMLYEYSVRVKYNNKDYSGCGTLLNSF